MEGDGHLSSVFLVGTKPLYATSYQVGGLLPDVNLLVRGQIYHFFPGEQVEGLMDAMEAIMEAIILPLIFSS